MDESRMYMGIQSCDTVRMLQFRRSPPSTAPGTTRAMSTTSSTWSLGWSLPLNLAWPASTSDRTRQVSEIAHVGWVLAGDHFVWGG